MVEFEMRVLTDVAGDVLSLSLASVGCGQKEDTGPAGKSWEVRLIDD